jgi:hypothetical protein
MKLVKQLKGGSLSKTAVYTDGSNKWVRKSILISDNREYGLVRWQSQLRKLQLLGKQLPKNVISVINSGIKNDYYFFDIPYIPNSHNLYEALQNGVDARLVANKLAKLIKFLASNKLNSIKGSISLYISEEVKRPMLLALEVILDNANNLSFDEVKTLKIRISKSLKIVEQLIFKYYNVEVHECLTHGNLTLENAIWDYETQNIILIDPYAETYCETILGDVSQIYQSSISGYEAVSNYIVEEDYSVIDYPYNQITKTLENFSIYLKKHLSNEQWYDEQILLILRASQFTRMFPFKLVNNPRSGFLFMNHAVELIGKIKC